MASTFLFLVARWGRAVLYLVLMLLHLPPPLLLLLSEQPFPLMPWGRGSREEEAEAAGKLPSRDDSKEE